MIGFEAKTRCLATSLFWSGSRGRTGQKQRKEKRALRRERERERAVTFGIHKPNTGLGKFKSERL